MELFIFDPIGKVLFPLASLKTFFPLFLIFCILSVVCLVCVCVSVYILDNCI